jgi:hypothetical protein
VEDVVERWAGAARSDATDGLGTATSDKISIQVKQKMKGRKKKGMGKANRGLLT